jgi:hypothetical protein
MHEEPLSEEGQRALSHIRDMYRVLNLCEMTLRQFIPVEDQKDSLVLKEIARVLRREQ